MTLPTFLVGLHPEGASSEAFAPNEGVPLVTGRAVTDQHAHQPLRSSPVAEVGTGAPHADHIGATLHV